MTPSQRNIIIIAVLAVVIVILGAVYFWPNQNQPTISEQQNDQNNQNTNPPPAGLEITAPKQNDAVTSPLKITGQVSGSGWTGFEGQVGTVRLLDNTGKELTMGILTATTDWMQLPTKFETSLYFDYPADGQGTLVFHNENASGELLRDKTYEMSVKLTKSSSAKSTLKVYFSNSASANASCSTVLYAERQIPKTDAIARAALEQLIKGPTDLEKTAGFSTNINQNTKILSLVIKDGVAKVDFSNDLQEGVAGSCKVTAIRAQIEQTLKQFSTIKSVLLSINGKTEDILQP